MKRKFFTVLLLSFILACGNLFAAKKLMVALYPDLTRAYGVIATNFMKANPDVQIDIKSKGFSDHHAALVAAMAAKKNVPDVTAVEVAFAGQLGAGGGFENLLAPQFGAGKYKKDIVSFAWYQGSVDEKTLFAIPVDIGPACAFYRDDLMKKEGVDYRKIKNFDDLYAVGKKLTKDTSGDGKLDQWLLAEYGVVFNTIIKSDSTRYFDKNGKPALDRPRVKTAVKWAKKFYDAGMCAQIGTWSSEWYAALGMKDGGIVCSLQGAWLAGHLSSWMATNLAGNSYRAAYIPSLDKGPNAKPLYASDGGSFVAIPKDGMNNNKELAWKFVEYLTCNTENQVYSFKTIAAFPTWLPAWKEPEFNQPVAYLGGQDARKIWLDIARKIPNVFVNEKDGVAAQILSAASTEIIMDKKDLDDTLKKANKELADMLE